VEIKMLLYIEYKMQGIINDGGWWGTEIGKLFCI